MSKPQDALSSLLNAPYPLPNHPEDVAILDSH
jgi:hypothetical protein